MIKTHILNKRAKLPENSGDIWRVAQQTHFHIADPSAAGLNTV